MEVIEFMKNGSYRVYETSLRFFGIGAARQLA